MKAVITITTDTAAEAEALGGLIEVEVVEVIVAADGELLTHKLRPLLIEHSSIFVADQADERNGPRVRIFTESPTANTDTEDEHHADDEITGRASQGKGQRKRGGAGKRRADGADEQRPRPG